MAPKAKGKPKQGKSEDVAALVIATPPPQPLCLPMPDSLIDSCAADRCLLLAWADPGHDHKLQCRPVNPGEFPEGLATDAGWVDLQDRKRVDLVRSGHYDAWLVSCEPVRLQYRLVAIKNPHYVEGIPVINWASPPSEPVATYVDPPIRLIGELNFDNDIAHPCVALSWQSSNMGALRRLIVDSPYVGDYGPFVAFPGLLPIKFQVRWRVVRVLSAGDSLPPHIQKGRHYVSPAIDNITRNVVFDARMETWRLMYRETIHGVVATFQIRAGTDYRWSAWSAESNEVEVEVPEPTPFLPSATDDAARPGDSLCINISKVTDRQVELVWPAFNAKGSLSWIEYRVVLCPLESKDSGPQWEKQGRIAKTFVLQRQPEQVAAVVDGLCPNTWYVIRVDARYPYVGKRTYSSAKAVSEPFVAPFLPRPPLQPIPLAIAAEDDLEGGGAANAVGPSSGDPNGQEGKIHAFSWNANKPWIALRVERGCLTDYDIQYKRALAAGDEHGQEYYESWKFPAAIEIMSNATPLDPKNSVNEDPPWEVIRVGFEEEVPEAIMCRLVHKKAIASISPLQWMVPTNPLVPFIAPPLFSSNPFCVSVTDEGVHLVVRIFLRKATDKDDPLLAGQKKTRPIKGVLRSSLTSQPGHRFVTRYQIRLRSIKESSLSQTEWVESEPEMLPAPCAVPSTLNIAGPTEADMQRDPLLESLSGCLGLKGAQYDVEFGTDTTCLQRLLLNGGMFEYQIRLANDHRWSAWAAPPSPPDDANSAPQPLLLSIPTPKPMQGSNLSCTVLSPTRIVLKWPPFDRMPRVTRIEYLVRAEPLLQDEGEKTVGESCVEGSGIVEKVLSVAHAPRQAEDWLLRSKLDSLKSHGHISMDDVVNAFEAARRQECEDDNRDEHNVEVELVGLLPCVRYEVTVMARYPSSVAINATLPGNGWAKAKIEKDEASDHSKMLAIKIETTGGDNAPAAPLPIALLSENMDVPNDARGALLLVEERPGYLLEYRPATSVYARFDALKKAPGFGGSWQEGADIWRRVQATQEYKHERTKGINLSEDTTEGDHKSVCLWAELPGFTSGPIPDAVEFRLCAAARSASHPCRWAGGISAPVATYLAPPRPKPKVRRVLSDECWCLSISLEIFKDAPAPYPPKLLSTFGGGDEDSEDEEEDPEVAKLCRAHTPPGGKKEHWAQSSVSQVPVGFGHRMGTVVQVRHMAHTAISPAVSKQIDESGKKGIWEVNPPIPIKSVSIDGSQCTLEVGSGVGLRDGGIYSFQGRVGDGNRWSCWSHSSSPFCFQVPPPTPPTAAMLGNQQAITVEVVSSTVARVRFFDFRPAPGLTMLEYEVSASPQQNDSGLTHRGGSVVTTMFEHRYRGGWIEREVQNLLPFIPYVFSVQARYPKVGNREWTGQRFSQPVSLEHPTAAQDPPAPIPVVELDEHDPAEETPHDEAGQGSTCSVMLEFPNEEDGSHYDLEYAHVLGNDLTSADLRTNQSLWLSPDDVGLPDAAGGTVLDTNLPRWRVRLPDISPFKAEPLKLAMLQRIRFRLRARFSSEVPTTRWWSSLSPPVCTGFAGPDEVTSTIIANSDHLAVEVGFCLDFRLANELATASNDEVNNQRWGLLEALRAEQPQKTSTNKSFSTVKQNLWPRGFGHPFVTRYQLRVRYKIGGHASGANEQPSSWQPWEFQVDSTLPKPLRQGSVGGMAAVTTSTRYARKYVVDLQLAARVRGLQIGDVVQIGLRVGDGVKWSSWRDAREVSVTLAPPRVAASKIHEHAQAVWIGDTCKISWPAALTGLGLDSVEYQLMIKPDSDRLPSRIGAIELRQQTENEARRPSIEPEVSDSNIIAKSFVKYRATLHAMNAFEERHHDVVEIKIGDLCPDLRYSFEVLARYPTVGTRVFTKLLDIPMVSWRPQPPRHEWTNETSDDQRISSAEPPTVEQLPTPEDDTCHGIRRVLLTWPGVRHCGGELELQACDAEKKEADSECEHEEAWCSCAFAAYVDAIGKPYIIARDLPFAVDRFRLIDASTKIPGPISRPMVALYEAPSSAPMVEMQALGRGAPRTLAVRVKMSPSPPGSTHQWASRWQVRFRVLSRIPQDIEENANWRELEPIALNSQGDDSEISLLVREEDGLQLGSVYVFAIRVGDRFSMSLWSPQSSGVDFSIPPPVPRDGNTIQTCVEMESARLSWSKFKPDDVSVVRMPGLRELPIEYMVTVYGGLSDEPVTSFVTRETQAVVNSLAPRTSYSASIFARWTRFEVISPSTSAAGPKTDSNSNKSRTRGLSATFVTAPASRQLAAELSLRSVPGEKSSTSFSLDGAVTSGLTQTTSVFLEPYFAGTSHLPQTSTATSMPKKLAANIQTQSSGVSAESCEPKRVSPSLPVLPPKFSAGSPSGPRRPVTSRITSQLAASVDAIVRSKSTSR